MMATMISMHVAVPIFDLLGKERKTDNLVYRTVLLGTIMPKDNVKKAINTRVATVPFIGRGVDPLNQPFPFMSSTTWLLHVIKQPKPTNTLSVANYSIPF